jgi:hypothetical protein
MTKEKGFITLSSKYIEMVDMDTISNPDIFNSNGSSQGYKKNGDTAENDDHGAVAIKGLGGDINADIGEAKTHQAGEGLEKPCLKRKNDDNDNQERIQ